METLARLEDELARQGARLDELRAWFVEFGLIVAHTHEDLRGLREHARLYDPACYEPPAPATAGEAE